LERAPFRQNLLFLVKLLEESVCVAAYTQDCSGDTEENAYSTGCFVYLRINEILSLKKQ
jgi:hypothetical protein